MQIVIDIPEEEFGIDINDKFQDFFQRLRVEIKEHLISGTGLVCGAYELETIEMFLNAFANSITLPKGHGDLNTIKKKSKDDFLVLCAEQEPCNDAISRKALIERINKAEDDFKADNMEIIASGGDSFVDGVLSGVFNIREMVIQAQSIYKAESEG